MKTILVTGRNGFVGRALVERLKKEYKVISLIRRIKEGIDYLDEELIITDEQGVKETDIKKYGIDLIIHLAAAIRGKAEYLQKNNVNISNTILNIAENLNIPVIYLSSTNVLFTDYLGAYAYSKKECEELFKKSKINYLIIRVPLIIGKDSSSVKTIKSFYKKFLFLPLLGKQLGRIQPVHISSVISKILTGINEDVYSGEILNFVGNRIYSYQEIISYLLGQDKKPRFIKIPFRLSKLIVKIFEKAGIPFFVSAEELDSVNMDKIIKPDISNNVEFINNDEQLLFS